MKNIIRVYQVVILVCAVGVMYSAPIVWAEDFIFKLIVNTEGQIIVEKGHPVKKVITMNNSEELVKFLQANRLIVAGSNAIAITPAQGSRYYIVQINGKSYVIIY